MKNIKNTSLTINQITTTDDYTILAPITATDSNGILLYNDNLQLQYADATHPGLVSTSAQTFAGTKTFDVINLPNTTSSVGIINQNGSRFIHSKGSDNLFAGIQSGNFTLSGSGNVGIGPYSLSSLTSSFRNTMCGNTSGLSITTGHQNSGFGYDALRALLSGTTNVALGAFTLNNLTSGSTNVAIGYTAGSNYTTSESNNICIGYNVQGVAGDNNVMRLGGTQKTTYIAGIRGVTCGAGNGIAVFSDSNGQLGTAASDARLKENIVYQLQDKAKDIVSKLKPCMFNYKSDQSKKACWGLLAQEAKNVIPEYVVKLKGKKEKQTKIKVNEDGKTEIEEIEEEPTAEELEEETYETIQYQYLPIIMLKEMQRLQKVVEDLQKQIDVLSKK